MCTITNHLHGEPEKVSQAAKKDAQKRETVALGYQFGIKGRKSPREVNCHFQNLIPDITLSTRDQQLLLPNRPKFTLPPSIDHNTSKSVVGKCQHQNLVCSPAQ